MEDCQAEKLQRCLTNKEYFIDLVNLLKRCSTNLLLSREFIGHQMSFYKGNLESDEFDEISAKYLIPCQKADLKTIEGEIVALFVFTDRVYDVEELSTMLNYEIDDCSKALENIIKECNDKKIQK